MKELMITYPVFKTIKLNYTLPSYHTSGNPGYVGVMASHYFIYVCNIADALDIADFEDNIKPSSIEASSVEDATALVCVPMKFSLSGYEVAQKGMYVDGKQLVIQPGSSSGYAEWVYGDQAELQGLDCETFDDTKYGDHLSLTVEHPVYGEIRRFGNNYYISANKSYKEISERVDAIPAGIKIRVTYNAIDSDGRKCNLRLRTFK